MKLQNLTQNWHEHKIRPPAHSRGAVTFTGLWKQELTIKVIELITSTYTFLTIDSQKRVIVDRGNRA